MSTRKKRTRLIFQELHPVIQPGIDRALVDGRRKFGNDQRRVLTQLRGFYEAIGRKDEAEKLRRDIESRTRQGASVPTSSPGAGSGAKSGEKP